MRRILAITALALGVFVPGTAAEPETEARLVNDDACEQTDPLLVETPGSARRSPS